MSLEIKRLIFDVLSQKEPVNGPAALRKIKGLIDRHACDLDAVRSFFLSPETHIGNYDGLPVTVRLSLEECADFYLKEKNLFSTPLLKKIGRGGIFKAGSKIIKSGWILKEKWSSSFLGKAFISVGRSTIFGCNRLSTLYLDAIRVNIFYKAPLLLWLIRYTKADASYLILDYIKNIPTHPHHSPVFKLPGINTIAGAMIGIDLLPSDNKLYFIECNSNPGHSTSRHFLFEEGDVVCNHLVNWAVEKGYSRIVFYPSNFGPSFDKEFEDAWQEISGSKNIELKIIDDPYIGSPCNREYNRFFDYARPDTLIVNGRYLWGPFSSFIGMKGRFDEEIKIHNSKAEQNDRIPIPRKIDLDSPVSLDHLTEDFPNMIIKNIHMDQAKGISLYRADKVPEFAKSREYVVYEFVKPDLIRKDGSIEQFVHIFRCYLLITPFGPVYLGCRKDVSGIPIKKELPFGKIEEIAPYITNICIPEDYSVPHSPDENEKCRKTSLTLGRIMYQNLIEKHDMTAQFRFQKKQGV
ncbi:MAG: hypothetical protein K9L30_01760 [Desulfobacterales bacterium]|nr:hypothetical protein [Desulfobacterales bacterium]